MDRCTRCGNTDRDCIECSLLTLRLIRKIAIVIVSVGIGLLTHCIFNAVCLIRFE